MIRVFVDRNAWTPRDPLSFVGFPPLVPPGDRKTPVRISVVFTWHKRRGLQMFDAWSKLYDDVKIGGPAFDDPGDEFVPGRYIKQGVTITSRGCPRGCSFCFASKREGKAIRELKIAPGHIVQDNNLFACSNDHVERVFDMLRDQKERADLRGLDARLMNLYHVDQILKTRIRYLWFAADDPTQLKTIARAGYLLGDMSIEKKRCYVLVGYGDETIQEAEARLERVFNLGFLPFAQLYIDEKGQRTSDNKEWRKLLKIWSRPAFFKAKMGYYKREDPRGKLF